MLDSRIHLRLSSKANKRVVDQRVAVSLCDSTLLSAMSLYHTQSSHIPPKTNTCATLGFRKQRQTFVALCPDERPLLTHEEAKLML